MISEKPTEDECYLFALTQDESGLDLAEFCYIDNTKDDLCFRAWPFQYAWWRLVKPKTIDAGARSVGKALDVTTPILTIDGWKTMGTVQKGDVVFNESGEQVKVTEAFEVMYDRPCFELVFDDDASIVADAEHRWVTETKYSAARSRKNDKPKKYTISTTEEIRETLNVGVKNESNHRIDVAKPLDLPFTELTINPYTLGVWLGDGTTKTNGLTIGDQDAEETIALIATDGYDVRSMAFDTNYCIDTVDQYVWVDLPILVDDFYAKPRSGSITNDEVFSLRQKAANGASLDELVELFGVAKTTVSDIVTGSVRVQAGGPIRPSNASKFRRLLDEASVLGDKHIPSLYKMASYDQRLALLQGIMDSDGHCKKVGNCEITLSSKRLIDDVFELLIGLGQKPTIHERSVKCNGVDAGIAWRIHFTPNGLNPFRMKRKLNAVLPAKQPSRISQRRIKEVNEVESRPVRCISVEGDSHLYLAGDHLIPTHNTLGIRMRAFAHPFNHPGEAMVITAPEANHLDAVTDDIENVFTGNKLAREMLVGGRGGIKHRPFLCNFSNDSKIMGRIPHNDGKNVKGVHPLILEMDEACLVGETLVLTGTGYRRIDEIEVGERVLTHMNRWRKVSNVWDRGERETLTVRVGDEEITATPNHRFFVISGSDESVDVHWVAAEDLDGSTFVGRPTAVPPLGCTFLGEHVVYEKITEIENHGELRQVYDIEVEEDHSFVAEGMIVHNSDYPAAGWTELNSTLKVNPKSRWRAHGVTRGVGDTFDEKISGKDSTWHVTKIPAMYRPNWNDEEKAKSIEEYGGYDSDGYRRNILGLVSESNSPLFVLSRIMKNVVLDLNDPYNHSEYYYNYINEAQIRENGDSILGLIDLPASHTHANYENTWIGMDFGWVQAPSAITVFGEVMEKGELKLKLLTRIVLKQVKPSDQLKVIMHLMETYRPVQYAMDATGAGQPVISLFMDKMEEDPENAWMAKRIKSFGFAEKIIVGFDQEIEINESDPNSWEKAAIRRQFIEASADAIRLLIDSARMVFPYDKDFIAELQSAPKSATMDAYGKSSKRKSGQHSLDAMRMAVLAQAVKPIYDILDTQEEVWEAPDMIIVDDGW